MSVIEGLVSTGGGVGKLEVQTEGGNVQQASDNLKIIRAGSWDVERGSVRSYRREARQVPDRVLGVPGLHDPCEVARDMAERECRVRITHLCWREDIVSPSLRLQIFFARTCE